MLQHGNRIRRQQGYPYVLDIEGAESEPALARRSRGRSQRQRPADRHQHDFFGQARPGEQEATP
jgi:hypothetical protein